MKKIALIMLALSVQACGPSVEFADIGVTESRPRPNACVSVADPKFASMPREQLVPAPAALGPVVLDSKSDRALIIGGLASSGVYAQRISVLDIVSLEHHVLSLEGAAVELPAFGAAIWDSENEQAVVIGGTAGGSDLAQVFSVRVDGNSAIIKRLPDFPTGSAFEPAAAYDPIGKRVLVVASIHAQDAAMELAYRATYSLDLRSGAESWSILIPGEAGPPQVQLGEARQMVYDPAQDRMILAASGTHSTLGGAWTLDLRDPKQWIGLAGTFPAALVATPALLWDEVSCSFLTFTKAKTVCAFDGWRMDVGVSALASSPLGHASFDAGGPVFGRMLFDTQRDRLLILGWGGCNGAGDFLDTVEMLAIER